jgi:hypothetical protein
MCIEKIACREKHRYIKRMYKFPDDINVVASLLALRFDVHRKMGIFGKNWFGKVGFSETANIRGGK